MLMFYCKWYYHLPFTLTRSNPLEKWIAKSKGRIHSYPRLRRFTSGREVEESGKFYPGSSLMRQDSQQQEGHDVDDFDHRVDGRPGSILVRVANRVTCNGGHVSI